MSLTRETIKKIALYSILSLFISTLVIQGSAISTTSDSITKLQKGETVIRFLKAESENGLRGAEGKILIKASPDEVWNLIHDQERMGKVAPGVRNNKVLARGLNSQKVQVSLKTAPALPVFKYTLILDENPKNRQIRYKRTEGSFKELYGSWQVEPYQNKSILTYTIFIDFGFYLPSYLQSFGINNTLPSTLKAIKNELERN